jgi:hypothetical protein
MALRADDVVNHVPGRSPLAGDFSGKSAYLDHYGRVFEQRGGTIEGVEVHDVLVGEGTRSSWSRSGRCAGNRALRATTRRVAHHRRQDSGDVARDLRPVRARRVLVLKRMARWQPPCHPPRRQNGMEMNGDE